MRIALVIMPLVMSGYLIGLPYGPKGVALGYSVAMTLWVIPHIAWCVHGTVISFWEVVQVLRRPLISGVVAAVFPFTLRLLYGQFLSPLPMLAVETGTFVLTYLYLLLYVMGQKEFYLNLLESLRRRTPVVVEETGVLV